ncbi:mediator of RNA polymerase II transcription subunit 11 [Favolaschia claudopus]|uniref:Mediator of RNA polymerase II transcription subunit 11 n=1 Tax=Favolaschia claudopus TaxID=2862362 RepID=A0AAW0EG69_9AGAR
MSSHKLDDEAEALETDPIWETSRTARQIFALGQVEKDITRLLALAASSISLLTLPQTDTPEDNLPQGDERSEQFVLEVSEYFERLDAIQVAIRSSLAHIRQSRIAPSAINAPPPNFVPPSLGVGLPSSQDNEGTAAPRKNRGLQEERIERDAWKGILDALQRLKAERDAQNQNGTQSKSSTNADMDTDTEMQS